MRISIAYKEVLHGNYTLSTCQHQAPRCYSEMQVYKMTYLERSSLGVMRTAAYCLLLPLLLVLLLLLEITPSRSMRSLIARACISAAQSRQYHGPCGIVCSLTHLACAPRLQGPSHSNNSPAS